MTEETRTDAEAQLQAIIDSAARLGVELDSTEAIQWLTAIAASQGERDQVTVDERDGVYGHRVAMLDFNPQELAYIREVGRLVEFHDEPGVETALALSGSAAQSKIQTYPGDCDYFERVNIVAPTCADACRTIARLMREKALETRKGTGYQLIEIKFGSFPADVNVGGRRFKAGAPIVWKPDQIEAGRIDGVTADGRPITITWDEAAHEPGWCKLDWVVGDPVRHRLWNASNVLDVTWEAPDGSIVPLDGYLDPYFQEVYLEADSIPIFTKLAKHVSADALDDYVELMEGEIRKYLTHDCNYGKAAKRMYNVFRLTGRYHAAAFVRELFDEPTALLYQVWSLIRTVDDVESNAADIPVNEVMAQVDQLIVSVIKLLEGAAESELISRLIAFREVLADQRSGDMLTGEAEAARQELINVVNNFFQSRLSAVPEIKDYMARF